MAVGSNVVLASVAAFVLGACMVRSPEREPDGMPGAAESQAPTAPARAGRVPPGPVDAGAPAAPAGGPGMQQSGGAPALQGSVPGGESASLPPAERLLAFGNEPFWSVEVVPGGLLWKTPENVAGTHLIAMRQPTLQGFRWAGQDGGREYSLDIVRGECSDGMSDRRHAYRSHWTVDGRTLDGCARSADGSGE